jgi:hypothetical protein
LLSSKYSYTLGIIPSSQSDRALAILVSFSILHQ